MVIKLRDENLKRSLKTDGVKSFYLLAGNEPYLISRCSTLIRDAVGGEVVHVDFCTVEDEEMEQQLSSYSFTDKLLVIDNFKASEYTEKKRKLYEEFMSDIPHTLHIVVKAYTEGQYFKLSKAAEGFANINPDSAIVTCEKRKDSELVKLVCSMAKECGSSLSYDNASMLIRLRGDDLFLLSGEIQKLSAACSYGEITPEVIRRMCPRTTEDSVFDFIRAVERGNTRQAISLFYDIMEQEQKPNAVIAAIASSYVNLARTAAAREAKVSREQLETDFGYKKGDRALGVAWDKGGRFSTSKLDEIIDLLYGINVRLNSSAEDEQITIERGMVQLAGIMGNGR